MSAANWFQGLYLGYLSRPRSERVIYRAMGKAQVRSIIEIGVGDGRRTQRLLKWTLCRRPASEVRYAGIDLFEARPSQAPGVTLKMFHRLVKSFGVQTLLSPGEPHAALARAANALVGADLIVISADHDPGSLAQAWFYVPRMLHDATLIFQEDRSARGGVFRRLSRLEVERLAQSSRAANDSGARKAA